MKSIKLLAEIHGKMEIYTSYKRYYQKYMDAFKKRMKQALGSENIKDRKKVFVEIGSGLFLGEKELKSFGNANIGKFIELAGGNHITSHHRGFTTSVSPEWVLKTNPDIVIITDCKEDQLKGKGLKLGYAAQSKSVLRKQLAFLWKKVKIHEHMKVFKNKTFYAIHQQFYNSPYHFVLILQLAKWFYPESFKDFNVEKIFSNLHEKFLAVPYSGSFWIAFTDYIK